MDSLPANYAKSVPMERQNVTESETEVQILENVSKVVYGYALPCVCVIGVVGNLMNLAILTRRKLQRSYRPIEQAANVCLVALALSDLMFCGFAFPTMLLPTDGRYKTRGLLLYYSVYSAAIINIFIMISTWLTVTMATERYLAICHPLKDTSYMTIKKTKVIIVFVFILSISFNIPVFWRYTVEMDSSNGTSVFYSVKKLDLGNSKSVDLVYRVFWAITGNFIPLILLVVFNICLCKKIHKSYKFRQKFKFERDNNDTSYTLTITLVVIVVMFLILVSPSEIVLFISKLSKHDNNNKYRISEVIFNFMQSVNFSANFVLYCIISPYFRRTLRYIICCLWSSKKSKKFHITNSSRRSHSQIYS